MRYELKKLTVLEINSLKFLLNKYKEHDILDILIEMIISDVDTYHERENRFEEKKEEIKTEKMDDSLYFCDSDKCVIPIVHTDKKH